MRVLFISERFPYPLDTGGNIRTFNLLHGLSRDHDITLVATTYGEVEKRHLEEVAKLCKEIRLIKIAEKNQLYDILKLCASMINRTPFVVYRHYNKAVHQEIIRAFQGSAKGNARISEIQSQQDLLKFDIVHFNHLDAAIYANDIPEQIIKILDEHNVVANQIKTTMETENRSIIKLLLNYEYWKLKKYEARICSQMDRCLVCSEQDKVVLSQLGGRSRMVVIPNGVNLDYFSFGSLANASDREIVFVGTLDYDPCEKGIWYFCSEILPLIKVEIPDVRFFVVGRNPSKRLQKIANANSGVILTGRVEDIRPFVYKARVFVVPLLSGSGTRLKILEAMAMGVPVVTTSIGVEGIEAINGEHIWIADSPIEFANAVMRLLNNLSETESMRKKARIFVEERYSWKSISQKLLDEYKLLLYA